MRQPSADDPHRIGPYRIVALLGSGGMGRVHLGLDRDGRPAAVKVVRAEQAYDPRFRERFARELALARSLHGPHVPRVYDGDPAGEPPWLATEYVMGVSLRELVERTGPLPTGSAILLGRGVAGALVEVHEQGAAHRDLKPGNVMVAAEGPRVIDFGIARAAEEGPGDEGVIGTPGYMAPEAGRGEPGGAPADVFALGGVLTYALTGHGPFGDGHPSTVLYRVDTTAPDLDGVPENLRGLLASCLAKDPRERPTAARVLRELGGPLPPAPEAAAWLPPRAAAEIENVTRRYRAIRPDPTPGAGGRRVLTFGAAVVSLALLSGFTVWSLAATLPESGVVSSDEEPSPEETGPLPLGDGPCSPTHDLAPALTGSASAGPTVPGTAGKVHTTFSHDGSVLAVAGDRGVALWDWADREEVALIQEARPYGHGPVEFATDDCLLGWATPEGARVHSLTTGESHLYAEGRLLEEVAFAPDRPVLTVVDNGEGYENSVYDIDLTTGETTLVYEGSIGFKDVVYAPDGAHVAGVSGSGELKVWDTGTGEVVHQDDGVPFGTGTRLLLLGDGEILFGQAEGPVHYDFGAEADHGWLFLPERAEPEGELAEFSYNPQARRLYVFYATEPEDGRGVVELFVWDYDSEDEYDSERELSEEEIAMEELSLSLTVHPEGAVVAGYDQRAGAVTLLEPDALGEVDRFI
ncbi:WD40 repeat domain-containing serine/threonine protein kinase [Nocardiopsis alba]|uniref:WD40 repeat domain-containing serine/threonine protein kinase n=1 Tax=Nocardiopsis alba TaxID=53437 RepID=UPI0033BC7F25